MTVAPTARENVPRRGPVILAANHLRFPRRRSRARDGARPSHFLVWDGSFDHAVGPLLRLSGQIPLAEAHGDRTGLGQALEVLKRNGVVGIFPRARGARGSRDREQGVAWLALQSRAAVVPTAVLGTRATGRLADSVPRPRSRLVVDFARPIIPTPPMGVPGKSVSRLRRSRSALPWPPTCRPRVRRTRHPAAHRHPARPLG